MFDQLVSALAPRTIGEITWEARTENMHFNLMSFSGIDDGGNKSTIKVNHILFQNWLDDEGYLDWVSDDEQEGEHKQTTGKHGYVDFIETWLSDKICYEFLKSQNLVFEPFDNTIV